MNNSLKGKDMISREAKNVMAAMARMKIPNIHEIPIELCRQGMADLMLFSPPPEGCTVEKVHAGGPHAMWIKTAGVQGPETVFYLHGGAYSMGSSQTHKGITGVLSEMSQVRVLSVDYRLAPENPHPAAVQDAVASYRWLLQQGVPAQSIVIGGDSAGGGLTFATMIALKENGEPLPAAAFVISPWVDLTMTGETISTKADVDPMFTASNISYMAQLYAGNADLRSPLISPLFADLKGLPPVLIHVGTSEMLLSDSRRMAEALKKANVPCVLKEWEDLFHVFHSVVRLPEAKTATEEIAAFIKSHIQRS
ncbi:MAG TPA: alpha/beta hydrolase [Smithella sp.]|nr:alpha/beta hydrolase [Smithella sp.]HOG89030.1 alpha/beta hydrolase [Smithella sp.]